MTVTCSLLVVILCLVSRAAEPPRVRENQQLGVAVEVPPVLRPNLTRCEENYRVSRNRDRQHPIEHDERGQV